MVNSVLSTFDAELDNRSWQSWLKEQLYRLPGFPKPTHSAFLSRFGFLLPALNEVGVEVRTYKPSGKDLEGELKHLEEEIQSADIVIHNHSLMRRSSSRELASRTDSLIREKYLHKAHTTTGCDKTYIARRMEEAGIPIPMTMEVTDYLAQSDGNERVVLKAKELSLGELVLYLDREQVKRFFDEATCRGRGVHPKDMPKPEWFFVQEFIEAPGDRFTSYRIFTVGDEILGGVINASGQTKSEIINRTRWSDKRYQGLIGLFRLHRSRLFTHYQHPADLFGTYPIVSNVAADGVQIPVFPFLPFRGRPTPLQKQTLEEHLIDVDKLGKGWPSSGPASLLYDRATRVGRLLTNYGMIIAGQDWIQDKKGDIYFLEANPVPGLGIFNRLYFGGMAKREVYTQGANSLIAAALMRYKVEATTT